MRRAAIFKWWKRFRNGEMNVKGEPRSGRLSTEPVPLSSWSLRQTVCSTFSRSGWSVVRSAPLVKWGTSKKRRSPHLHKVPTRRNKVSPRTFQTALVNRLCSNSHWSAFLYRRKCKLGICSSKIKSRPGTRTWPHFPKLYYLHLFNDFVLHSGYEIWTHLCLTFCPFITSSPLILCTATTLTCHIDEINKL
jgi:hypothetical protein